MDEVRFTTDESSFYSTTNLIETPSIAKFMQAVVLRLDDDPLIHDDTIDIDDADGEGSVSGHLPTPSS